MSEADDSKIICKGIKKDLVINIVKSCTQIQK